MSIERTHPRHPGFGDSAMALDVVMQLTIDLLVQRDPEFGIALRDAIDALLDTDGPSSGTRATLQC